MFRPLAGTASRLPLASKRATSVAVLSLVVLPCFGNVNSFKLQPLNASFPMLVTPDGILMSLRPPHPLKALSSIEVRFFGRVIDIRETCSNQQNRNEC